jgi:hypothetical protein
MHVIYDISCATDVRKLFYCMHCHEKVYCSWWWHGEESFYKVSPPTGMTLCTGLHLARSQVIHPPWFVAHWWYNNLYYRTDPKYLCEWKDSPIEAGTLDMTNATRSQPTRFLGLGFFSLSASGRILAWKDPRLMEGKERARLSSLVHRPATPAKESVGISLWRLRQV